MADPSPTALLPGQPGTAGLKEALRAALEKAEAASRASSSPKPAEDENLLFEQEYKAVNLAGRTVVPGNAVVPHFYAGLPPEDDELRQKLREEARAQFLQRRNKALLDNEELKALYSLLEANASAVQPGSAPATAVPGHQQEECMLNYRDFLKVRGLAGEKCRPYFSAKIFAKLLHGDLHGRISVMAFFNYVMRKVWLHQTRIGLSLYDVNGQGFLREMDMENYIAELIETLPQLNSLDKSLRSFYVCTAVRKFFFFLDPLRTGKIKISDILACSFLDDLLELRDQDLTKEAQEANWFSAPSALRVYGQYLNLDKDHNGMLSKSELLSYGTGTLTPAFVDRVFQECLTYGGEMDYKTYLDFVLAMENRREPQALSYFFRILDVKHEGSLNCYAIHYFFRDILKQMQKLNQDTVKFEDVKDEIFDMVKPEDPLRITLQDLVGCGHGGTVVSILTDLNGFWAYEDREVLVSDNAAIEYENNNAASNTFGLMTSSQESSKEV